MKKKYLRPTIRIQLIQIEDNITAASISTGGSNNTPGIDEETSQEGDLVEWEFN